MILIHLQISSDFMDRWIEIPFYWASESRFVLTIRRTNSIILTLKHATKVKRYRQSHQNKLQKKINKLEARLLILINSSIFLMLYLCTDKCFCCLPFFLSIGRYNMKPYLHERNADNRNIYRYRGAVRACVAVLIQTV